MHDPFENACFQDNLPTTPHKQTQRAPDKVRPGIPKDGDEIDVFRIPHDVLEIGFCLRPLLSQVPRRGGMIMHDVYHFPGSAHLREGQQADKIFSYSTHAFDTIPAKTHKQRQTPINHGSRILCL